MNLSNMVIATPSVSRLFLNEALFSS